MIGTRFVSVAVLALIGCSKSSPPTGIACTALAAAGLGVSITDSLTGVHTGFTNVSVVARTATYKDSVFVAVYQDTIPLAYEHRGTVQVIVRADGYAVWVNNNVTITGDVCHVHEEFVTARLIRSVTSNSR